MHPRAKMRALLLHTIDTHSLGGKRAVDNFPVRRVNTPHSFQGGLVGIIVYVLTSPEDDSYRAAAYRAGVDEEVRAWQELRGKTRRTRALMRRILRLRLSHDNSPFRKVHR